MYLGIVSSQRDKVDGSSVTLEWRKVFIHCRGGYFR